MSNLIKVDNSGKTTAKELYEFLELRAGDYSRWCKSNIEENQFAEENVDYFPFRMNAERGAQATTNYNLTTEFAKKLCMVSKSPKGEQARNYFIEVEKRFLAVVPIMQSYMIEDPIKRAEKWIEEQREKQLLQLENAQSKQIINELKPKADYTDLILKNKGLVTITQISKDYGMSGQEMNKLLHILKVQYKQSKQWLLYSEIQDKGYTHSETINFKRKDGRDDVNMNTKWTQKGRLYLYNLLKNNGILPLIERKESEAV